jgi:hypothetical protein
MNFYLILPLENIFSFVNYNYSYYILTIVLFLVEINLVLLYLLDFKSSFSRLILALLVISLLFIYFLFVYDSVVLSNLICSVDEINNNLGTNVKLEGHVHMNDEKSGKSWALTGAMVGLGGVAGKAIAKAPMPPLAKAGVVVGAGVFAGIAHKVIDNSENVRLSSVSQTSNSTISKFLGDSQVSALQDSLFLQEIFYLVGLYMVFLLVIQLIFKLHLKDSVNLNLSRFLGANFNNKVEYYLNKIIYLNKRMSIFWLWFGIMAITYGIGTFTYALYRMGINIDNLVNAHISLNPIRDDLHFTDRSIEEILSYLQWGNYMCLFILFFLMIQITFKFHLNKDINNIYIWLLVLALIVILTFSAYISGDLYTNLDNYIYTYNSLRS